VLDLRNLQFGPKPVELLEICCDPAHVLPLPLHPAHAPPDRRPSLHARAQYLNRRGIT